MRAQLFWVLMTACALLFMDGSGCPAAQQLHGDTTSAAHVATMAPAGSRAEATAMTPAHASGPEAAGQVAIAAVAPVLGQVAFLQPGHDAGRHSELLHVLIACLAVLAAGAAAVTAAGRAWLIRRLAHPRSVRARAAQSAACELERGRGLATAHGRFTVLLV